MEKQRIDDFINFLRCNFTQDIESVDNTIKEIINDESKEYLLYLIEILTEYINMNINNKDKIRLIKENVYIYYENEIDYLMLIYKILKEIKYSLKIEKLLRQIDIVIKELEEKYFNEINNEEVVGLIYKRYKNALEIIKSNKDINKLFIIGGVRAYMDVYSDYDNAILGEMYKAEKINKELIMYK